MRLRWPHILFCDPELLGSNTFDNKEPHPARKELPALNSSGKIASDIPQC